MTPSQALQQYAAELALTPEYVRLALVCVDCDRHAAGLPWPVAEPDPVCARCDEKRRARTSRPGRR